MHERALSEMCIRTKNLAQPVDEYDTLRDDFILD